MIMIRFRDGELGDWLVVAMAVWTVSCNVCAFTGGGLYHAMVISFFTVLVLFVSECWTRQNHASIVGQSQGLVSGRDSEASGDLIHESPYQRALVWAVVVIAVILTLISHRPDQDDCQWISWAEAAVANPWAGILVHNTMNAPPFTPIVPVGYRFHSFEMLAAAVSVLTSVPPIFVFHLLFAPLAAAFAIFSYRRLMRVLSPRFWGFGVLAVFVFLCSLGDTHRSWGNFSFVRLHQAKGILVTVLLPLIVVYALRWSQHPTRRGWILLAASQIVALGASFSAIFVAPPVAALAVMAGLPPLPLADRIRRVLLGMTSSIYVVCIAIAVRVLSSSLGTFLPDRADPRAFSADSMPLLLSICTHALEVFGGPRSLAFAAVVIGLAWFVAETSVARRLWVFFSAGLLIFFFNPIATTVLVLHVTGIKIYWRTLWILPFPALVATVLLVPLSCSRIRWPYWLRVVVFVLLLVFVSRVPGQNIFSSNNRALQIGVPSLKVSPDRAVAAVIAKLPASSSGDRRIVVGPDSVTLWLPTFPHHPFPLLARQLYSYTLGSDAQQRFELKRYVSGHQYFANGSGNLERGIRSYSISCICLPKSNPWGDQVREVLNHNSFELYCTAQEYEVWISRD